METKLSLRGKIGLFPSFFLTIPFFIILIVGGFCLWLLAKTFNFCGITEAIQYQLRTFDSGILKGRKVKSIINDKKVNSYEGK